MLNNLAPHSRVWIYQANRKLTDSEISQIKNEMTAFIREWASHGNELFGEFEIIEPFFLIVGADEKKCPTSGCSLDSLTRQVKAIGEKINVDFFNRLNIAVINKSGEMELIDMMEFKARAQRDEITSQTIVFNNLIETKAELEENWKTKAADSWHKNLFEII